MSFAAKLQIDGQEWNVVSSSFTFDQKTDHTGKPVALTQGGSVTVDVESSSGTELMEWVIKATALKSGNITYYRRDTMSKMKLLEFTDAYCVSYREQFHAAGATPMTIHLQFNAKVLKVNDAEFKNNWPE